MNDRIPNKFEFWTDHFCLVARRSEFGHMSKFRMQFVQIQTGPLHRGHAEQSSSGLKAQKSVQNCNFLLIRFLRILEVWYSDIHCIWSHLERDSKLLRVGRIGLGV